MADERAMKAAKKFLSPKEWVDVQARYESGEKMQEIAVRYGISKSTICKNARRYGWAPHGSLKKEAVKAATESVKEELKLSYRDRVKEINENHLKSFRQTKALAQKAMYLLNARLQWKLDEFDRLTREALARGEYPPTPSDISKEVQTLLDLVNINKQTIMTCERVILGIEGAAALDKEEADDHGLDGMIKALQELRRDPEALKRLWPEEMEN